MNDNEQKKVYPLNNSNHTIRASQAVFQYGVGSMVDFPEQTLMTAAPEFWPKAITPIHDERLEKVLHVNFFGMPDSGENDEGIAYVRFPKWYFCPKCRKFQPIDDWVDEYNRKASLKQQTNNPNMTKRLRCPVCHQDLSPARIVVICQKGHIDDFPWVQWVHCRNIGGAKDICNHPDLKFKTAHSSSEGLESVIVTCENCHARASLAGSFDNDIFYNLDKKYPDRYNFTCTGNHPWKHIKNKCDEYPKTVQRGSSSVYFPVTASSLVIPPYSSILTGLIENSREYSKYISFIKDLHDYAYDPNTFPKIVESTTNNYAEKIADELFVDSQDVLRILKRKLEPAEVNSTTSNIYRAEEYDALNGTVSVNSNNYNDFYRESMKTSDYNIPYLKCISLIHKIREVQVLTGFTRVKPAERGVEASTNINNVVSIKKENDNWLPGIQVRGEGIFIEFDEDAIDKWAKNEIVKHRVSILNDNLKKSYLAQNGGGRTVDAKYVLLHTISHLLIKELSFDCGYNIASINERLYCSTHAEDKKMAGILIYTASGDSEGTLGGLVRQGRPDLFSKIFRKAIESAKTCSNDPVCSLSEGQGRDSLNLSACYSCALIPETSCEDQNILLDRGMIAGTFDDNSYGFYSPQLFKNAPWECTINNKYNRIQEKNREKSVLYVTFIDGMNMAESPYKTIFKDIAGWSSNKNEIEFFDNLCAVETEMSGKEKPYMDAKYLLSGNDSTLECCLMWKQSKVMIFTYDQESNYQASKESDWHCILASDPEASPDDLLKNLKEI